MRHSLRRLFERWARRRGREAGVPPGLRTWLERRRRAREALLGAAAAALRRGAWAEARALCAEGERLFPEDEAVARLRGEVAAASAKAAEADAVPTRERRRRLAAARREAAAGRPEAALACLQGLAGSDEAAVSLRRGLELWLHGRRLLDAGYLPEAEAVLAVAEKALPRLRPLAAERVAARREREAEAHAVAACLRARAGRPPLSGSSGGKRWRDLQEARRRAAEEDELALASAREALAAGLFESARRRLLPVLARSTPPEARELWARATEGAARLARDFAQAYLVGDRAEVPAGVADHPALHALALSEPAPPLPHPGQDTERFVLRVDEGPEVLLVVSETVRLGHATNPRNHVAFLAPVRSEHARLARRVRFHEGIGYVLAAAAEASVTVNGETVGTCELRDGDRIGLGEAVRLRFHRPVAVSASALLLVEAGHCLDGLRRIVLVKPGRDGRIVLGLGPEVHVPVRTPDRPVFLYYEAGALRLEGEPEAKAGDRPCRTGTPLPPRTPIQAGGVTFLLEAR